MVVASGRVTIEPFGLLGHQGAGFVWIGQGPALARPGSLQPRPAPADRAVPAARRIPGPLLERFLERFFPGVAQPTLPANHGGGAPGRCSTTSTSTSGSPDGRPEARSRRLLHLRCGGRESNPFEYVYVVGHRWQGHRAGTPEGQLRPRLGAHRVQRRLASPSCASGYDLGLDREDAVEIYYNAALRWLARPDARPPDHRNRTREEALRRPGVSRTSTPRSSPGFDSTHASSCGPRCRRTHTSINVTLPELRSKTPPTSFSFPSFSRPARTVEPVRRTLACARTLAGDRGVQVLALAIDARSDQAVERADLTGNFGAGKRRFHGAAAAVPEHHEDLGPEHQCSELEAGDLFGGNHVARHPVHEDLAEALIEDDLHRYP